VKIFFATWKAAEYRSGMSPDQNAIEEAEKAGFDLSLVDLSLAVSPEERVLQHAAALQFALELSAAGAAYYAQSALAAQPAR
jgi:hypothetical protein